MILKRNILVTVPFRLRSVTIGPVTYGASLPIDLSAGLAHFCHPSAARHGAERAGRHRQVWQWAGATGASSSAQDYFTDTSAAV